MKILTIHSCLSSITQVYQAGQDEKKVIYKILKLLRKNSSLKSLGLKSEDGGPYLTAKTFQYLKEMTHLESLSLGISHFQDVSNFQKSRMNV